MLFVRYTESMKASAFNKLIAQAYTIPEKTVVVYARLLKEAGLLTTGARGRNAPDMTPLDAARITIAVLASNGPAQCVERVRRFGQLKYAPDRWPSRRGWEAMQEDRFSELFKGYTLEAVLAHLFSLPATMGIEESCAWFSENDFHLRVFDFEVKAELFQWKMDAGQIVGELIIPFVGDRFSAEFTPIKGGIRTERSIIGLKFLEIGMALTLDLSSGAEAA